MEMLQGVWKQHLRPRAVVGYGAKISLPSPPNYVTRSPGTFDRNSIHSADACFLVMACVGYSRVQLKTLSSLLNAIFNFQSQVGAILQFLA